MTLVTLVSLITKLYDAHELDYLGMPIKQLKTFMLSYLTNKKGY
jgi:hypothetical protein